MSRETSRTDGLLVARRGRSRRASRSSLQARTSHVYIGQTSKWGHPFAIGRDGMREQVIERYERWLLERPALSAALAELCGKVLGCWCAPRACHGDVLVRLANEPR